MSTTQQAGQALTVRQPVNRAEAIRRGYGAAAEEDITLDLSKMSPEDRALIAARLKRYSAGYDALCGHNGHPLRVEEPTPKGVMDAAWTDEAVRLEEAAKAEAQRVRDEADAEELVKWMITAATPIFMARSLHSAPLYSPEMLRRIAAENDGPKVSEGACKLVLADERIQPVRAEVQKLESERAEEARLRKEEAAQRKAAEEARQQEERAEWVRAHGSTRLRRLLEEGIEHEAVYRDERLALERPEWRWDERPLPGEASEPRNAPVAALELLDEARKAAPDARLVYWVVEQECDCGHYGCEDEDSHTVRGYTCEARFLGRQIVFRVQDDGTPPVLMD